MDKIEELSELLKALSDPTRLKIVRLLSMSDSMLCVNALTVKIGVTQSAVSQHLRILRQIGLVISERRGYFIHYSINKNKFDKISILLNEIMQKDQ